MQLLHVAIVGEDHVLAVGITLEDHVGVQQAAQLPQEVQGVVAKLVGWHQDHYH